MNRLRQWGRSGAVVVGLALLAGCDKKAALGPRLVYTGPLMETTNVRTLFSDSAKLKLQLIAPLEQQFEDGNLVYPKGAVVTLYSSDGKKNVVNIITGKYAKYEKAKNLYTMRGDVQVTNVPEQQRLNTQEIFLDRTKEVIYTDSAMFVKVTTPTEYLTGYGLKANMDFSRYRITKPEGIFAAPQAAVPAR